jgi:hypothetical protein
MTLLAKLDKKSIDIYAIRTFIAVFTTAATEPYSEPDECSPHPATLLIQDPF